MMLRLWRYSHFALALSSGIFILLAALTGIILALEPIENQLDPYKISDARGLPLAEVIETLRNRYDEVLELSIDANDFVQVSVISMNAEADGDFYINPHTGEKIGDIPPKRPFFEFVTNLHRSLFLKSTGRIIIGISSFFLCLIAITGTFLLIKRQAGIRNFFAKIIKEDFAAYYHVLTGRLMIIPVIIIALSGVYLSLLRFSLIPENQLIHLSSQENIEPEKTLPISAFSIFQETRLKDVRKLEFPFSADIDDLFILTLIDKQLKINQKNGQIIEEYAVPSIDKFSALSFRLHTGEGSILWSIVLFVGGINILFFLYSGTIISYKRLSSKISNSISPKEAKIVILVGSENGSTKSFAKLLQKALLKEKVKVYLDALNAYQVFEQMEHLLVITSTYGDGDPPANADKFVDLFHATPISRPITCSVLGFGSWAYPNFCQYAREVHTVLQAHDACTMLDEAYLIHNRSYPSFLAWAQTWNDRIGVKLDLPSAINNKKIKTEPFEVHEKQVIQDAYSDTFVMRLTTSRNNFQSGDLLAIFSPQDPIERLYSIAKVENNNILLSIKRHEMGVCSNFLFGLETGAHVEASIKKNKDFHFPKKASSVYLIANGTGIAPFLGMIQHARPENNVSLYWGGRTEQSYALYKPFIDRALERDQLSMVKNIYSREGEHQGYVQDLIKQDGQQIFRQLEKGGHIMLCGSISMQQAVLDILQKISIERVGHSLSAFQNKGQILMDCY